MPLLHYELKCGTTLYYCITAELASFFVCPLVRVCLTVKPAIVTAASTDIGTAQEKVFI